MQGGKENRSIMSESSSDCRFRSTTVMSESLFERRGRRKKKNSRGVTMRSDTKTKSKGSEVFHLPLINLALSGSAITCSGYSRVPDKEGFKAFYLVHEVNVSRSFIHTFDLNPS